VQLLAPLAALNDPAAHRFSAVAPVVPTKLPGSAGVHEVEPAADAKVPRAHAVSLDAPSVLT